ncbi:MAG: hypothetical protein ABW171_07535 [Steroidobacter sp.]
MRRVMFASISAIATVLAIAACAHGPRHSPRNESAAQPTTVDIQGAGEWKRSPHMRAYYDLTTTTFAHGTDIDVDAYEAKSFALFREFARANGMNEQGMIDHLKLIPRQVVGIVKENPAVLKDYDSFWAALAGPD